MSNERISVARRGFVGGLTASAGLMATAPFSSAAAQSYPNRRISVVIPTGQGGGAERIARPVDSAWGPLL
jgi:tripartite-type tricarboxylate transporter receptor subunit TctC